MCRQAVNAGRKQRLKLVTGPSEERDKIAHQRGQSKYGGVDFFMQVKLFTIPILNYSTVLVELNRFLWIMLLYFETLSIFTHKIRICICSFLKPYF